VDKVSAMPKSNLLPHISSQTIKAINGDVMVMGGIAFVGFLHTTFVACCILREDVNKFGKSATALLLC